MTITDMNGIKHRYVPWEVIENILAEMDLISNHPSEDYEQAVKDCQQIVNNQIKIYNDLDKILEKEREENAKYYQRGKRNDF